MEQHGFGVRSLRVVLATLILAFGLLAGCGGGHSFLVQGQFVGTGSVTTSISDAPTCAAPGGPFLNVWVTITRVRAHTSPTADPKASGWVELVDLRNSPAQVDLLSLASSCTLTTLGSIMGVPAVNFQQIRVVLLSNNPGTGQPTPSPNQCRASGFNCAVLADGSTHMLQLSSEADAGIEIPPSQIAGGGITLTSGQSTDINIDFNACGSVVRRGSGLFGLKPSLHASKVSGAVNSISGRMVDSSRPPVAIPNAIVLLEQPDSNGIDRVVRSRVGGSDGTFVFCPVPTGAFDIAAAGQTTSGAIVTTFRPTVLFNVPTGTVAGDIPLFPESVAFGVSSLPAEISGQVTTAGLAGMAALADVTLSPLEQLIPTVGAAVRLVTIPVFGAVSEPPNVPTQPSSTCPVATNCAPFALLVPSGIPEVAIFNPAGTAFAPPGAGNGLFTLEAQAPNCSPSTAATAPFSMTSGLPITQNLSLTGCQ